MNVLIRFLTLTLGIATVMLSVSSAVAQSGKPPRDPAAIQRKVQRSADLQRQALEALSDPDKAAKLARSAYTDLKSAYDDMIMNASNSKFPDPVLDLSSKKTGQALGLVQVAADTLDARARWSNPVGAVAGVRSRLQQSLQLTTTVAATGF